MTKSTKNGEVVYNFLDYYSDDIEITQEIIGNDKLICLEIDLFADSNQIMINQATAKDLIKVLQEFAETGELK